MGTTRIKVIDLSSDQQEIKTSRKHAEKLAGPAKKIDKSKKEREKEDKRKEIEEIKEKKIAEAKAKEEEIPQAEKKETEDKIEVKEEKEVVKESKSPKKPKHSKGKKYKEAKEKIEVGKIYNTKEALEILYATSYTKFDPTVELHLNVVDKKVRGSVDLPHPFAQKKVSKILVFADPDSVGADPDSVGIKNVIWGTDATIEEIENGKLKPNKDFGAVYATATFMPKLAKIAKILGPTNMMPNPKNGTIIKDVQEALAGSSKGTLDYKSDPTAPIIHTKLGKLSNKPEEIKENLAAIVTSIGPTKIRKATITSTMSPPIRFDVTTV